MLSKSKKEHLHRIKAVAQRIIECCPTTPDGRQPLPLSGLKPIFLVQDDDYFLPAYLTVQLSSTVRENILGAIRQRIMTTRSQILRSFDVSAVLLVQVRGTEDRNIEQHLCDLYDSRFQAFQARVKEMVEQNIHAGQADRDDSRRSYSFSSRAIEVLEKAFAHSETLTTAECAEVARIAGITHQQVRTWFQNKRNRGNKKNRSASTSALNQRVSEEVVNGRRVISLPTRNKRYVGPIGPSSLSSAQPKSGDGARAIRGLPRRKGVVSTVSPSPSLSSLDSISPSGGFTSPFQQDAETTISFPESVSNIQPNVDSKWSAEGLTTSPVEFDPHAYLLFNSLEDLNIGKQTLVKSPSIGSIDTSLGGSIEDVERNISDSFGDSEFMDLINNLFEDAGANSNINFDFGLDAIDSSLSGFSALENSFDDFGSMGEINLDALTEFFNPAGQDLHEATVVIEEVNPSVESGRSTPSLVEDSGSSDVSVEMEKVSLDAPVLEVPTIAVTEPTPIGHIASSPIMEQTMQSVQTIVEGQIAQVVGGVSKESVEICPSSSSLLSSTGVEHQPVPAQPASVVSIEITPSAPQSYQQEEIRQQAYQPVQVEYQPPYVTTPLTHPVFCHPSQVPHEAYTASGMRDQVTWIENTLPFDNYYAWPPHPPPPQMMASEEWVMIPRSSLPAAYSGAILPSQPVWQP